MKKFTLLTLMSSLCFAMAYSQAGELDSSFGTNGVVRANFGTKKLSLSATARQVLTEKNGTAYLLVTSDNGTRIARLLTDGTIDSSYGSNGYTQPIAISEASGALQTDGKVVVAGKAYSSYSSSTDFALARFDTDGKIDSAFSEDGMQMTEFGSKEEYGGSDDVAKSLAIQDDGKIVVTGFTDYKKDCDYSGSSCYGTFDFALARYNTDGTLDSSFSKDGMLTTDFSFDIYVGSDVANAVAIQSDGKIVVAGVLTLTSYYDSPHDDIGIARYNTNGTLDTSFSDDGRQSTDLGSASDVASSVAIQSDGKIVVGGYTLKGTNRDIALERYNRNGSLDSTFSKDGKLTAGSASNNDYATSIVIQPDDKIVVAGYSSDGTTSD